MTDLAQWQANNDQYLGLALQWLRLRLARLATGDNGLGDEIAAVAERMASVTDPRWPETPPPALRLLGQQFGLSSFEEEILQYKKHRVEYFAFWSEHPAAFALFKKADNGIERGEVAVRCGGQRSRCPRQGSRVREHRG